MKKKTGIRVAKFCETNIKVTEAGKAMNILRQHYQADVDVCVVDCFKRCLECRVKPFCRIQLTTVDGSDAESLVKKILLVVKQE